MTQLTDNFYAVPVPIWANGFKIECIPQADLYELVCYHIGVYDEPLQEKSIDLPPGSYTFLFTTKDVTEEQARKVVAWIEIAGKIGYYDYMNPQPYRYFDNYVDSLRSLLKAKGCEGEWAVVEKITSREDQN